MHEDYRACAKHGCRRKGSEFGRGVDSAPTGRKRNSGEGEGDRSADACPCAKVRWQHPVTSRSSTRAHRSSRGRIESADLCREFSRVADQKKKNVTRIKNPVRVRNDRASFRFVVTSSDDLDLGSLILPPGTVFVRQVIYAVLSIDDRKPTIRSTIVRDYRLPINKSSSA